MQRYSMLVGSLLLAWAGAAALAAEPGPGAVAPETVAPETTAPEPAALETATPVADPPRAEPEPADDNRLAHDCLAAPADPERAAFLADLEQRQLPIGDIGIVVDPIFDTSKPEEDYWLFHLINDWHVPTAHEVIADDLLIDTGEPFNAARMAESERLLRTRRYLRDATIRPVGDCHEAVDLEVRVKDVWTLLPDVSFSRGGGENSSRFGFRDSNFLGTGRLVTLVREQEPERSGTTVTYFDPNFGNTRSVLDLEHANNDDGRASVFGLYRPFYALETPWSGGVQYLADERDDTLRFRDTKRQSFVHTEHQRTLFGGWSRGLIGESTNRYLFGVSTEQSRFRRNDDSIAGEPLPADRRFSYLWFEWQRIASRFVKAVNVNQMRRTEDLNLGLETRFRLGRTSGALDSVDDAWLYRASIERYFLLDDDKVLFSRLSVNGYHGEHGPLNQRTAWESRYHHGDFATHQFYAGMRLEHGRNLFVDQPITLGGDNGLRGYPLKYQNGDRAALLSLEERFYLFSEVLALFDVGAAVFTDVGRAWSPDQPPSYNDGWLRDVGFGLRLTPTRTGSNADGSHTVLHLDLAAPLDTDEDPDLDRVQWLLTIRDSF